MNFFKRLWRFRLIRAFAWLLGSLLTLYGLGYAWVNYSGAKQWSAAQVMLQREGESLDFQAIALPPVPEEKNFCAIPALKDIALVIDGDTGKGEPGARRKRIQDTTLPLEYSLGPMPRPKKGAGAFIGTPWDLKSWADWFRKEGSFSIPPDSGNPARDVLAALSKYEGLFTELTAGLSRPEAHWTPEWKTRQMPEMLFAVPLPHYGSSQHLVYLLTLRATAAARAGDATTAHQSVLIALRLARASQNEPFLIGELVACSQTALIANAIWELCDDHAGTPEDFRLLQEELTRLNFEKALLRSFRAEMAAGTGAVMWMKRRANPDDMDMFYGQSEAGKVHASFWPRLEFRAVPGGLFQMNATAMAELEFNHLIKPLRDGGLRGSLNEEGAFEKIVRDIPTYRIDKVFARLAVPSLDKLILRNVYIQNVTNQAITACALERWFSGHHAYPDSLEPLGSMPLDLIPGKPMGYRKTPDGKFALWCVGFDGNDHGGKRVLDPKKPESTKFSDLSYKGDWVWSYQP